MIFRYETLYKKYRKHTLQDGGKSRIGKIKHGL